MTTCTPPKTPRTDATIARRAILLWVYVLPLPLCAASVLAAYWQTRSWPFVLHLLVLPVVYGYVVPGIATNLLHRWHFKGPLRVGHYYVHHGFMYAGNMMPLLLIALLGQTPETFTVARAASVVACTAALHGFVLWIHDIGIVRHGMAEIYNRPGREGLSPEEIVTRYAPLCFTLIGGAYAASAVVAYEGLVVRQMTGLVTQCWMLALGVVLTFSVPSLAYRRVE